jgi:hypothetical protein
MEHAIVLWDGAQWLLRDLRSRNGTIVNGKPLLVESPLKPGDNVTFGDPEERWCWVDCSAPEACAIRSDGQVVWALDGLLLLPDETAPAVSIYASSGGWEMDIIGDVRVAEDGQELRVGEQRFQLDLPPFDPASTHTRTIPQAEKLVRAHIRFQVSSDEEHVAVTLEINGAVKDLSSRASHYMLLVLARARLDDARRGIATEDAGWLYVDDLARQLGTDADTLNVQVHRARRSVARASSGGDLGPPAWDCQSLIERRRSQIRLGIANISVQLAADSETRLKSTASQ